VVPGARPFTVFETLLALDPEPALDVDVFDP
jgi:hypothetical protein